MNEFQRSEGRVRELELQVRSIRSQLAAVLEGTQLSGVQIIQPPPSLSSRLVAFWIDPTGPSTSVAKITVGPMPVAGTFLRVTAKTKEGETCGATSQLVDVHLQLAADQNTDTSATIWATQANRPAITNGNKEGASTLFDTLGFSKGDFFLVYSDQLGDGLTALAVGIEVLVS